MGLVTDQVRGASRQFAFEPGAWTRTRGGGRMVYKYEWAQMQTLDSPVQSDGNLSPGGAARMRMIALTPRRSLEKAASRLAATGYSPTNRTQFEAQALEKELLPGFRGFFSNKERMPEGLGSPAESLRSRPPRSLVSTRAGEGDRFARSAGLESERDEPAPPEPFSPKKRGCAVAPCLSDLRLDDANLRCEAPSPGPQWSNETVKTIFPGPCKVPRPPLAPGRGGEACRVSLRMHSLNGRL